MKLVKTNPKKPTKAVKPFLKDFIKEGISLGMPLKSGMPISSFLKEHPPKINVETFKLHDTKGTAQNYAKTLRQSGYNVKVEPRWATVVKPKKKGRR